MAMPSLKQLLTLALSAAVTTAWHNHGCLLARPTTGQNHEDLRQCFNDHVRGNDAWDPVWCAQRTFYRDGANWHAPADCAANCASCLEAGFDSGADAVLCYRRQHSASCQMGYTRRTRDHVMTGDSHRVCDHKAWCGLGCGYCDIREAQVAWVNLARPEDDSWTTGAYLSRWEFVDVQAVLEAREKDCDCTRGGCMSDAGGDGAWSREGFAKGLEPWRTEVDWSMPTGDANAGVPASPAGPNFDFEPRPVDVPCKGRKWTMECKDD